MKHARSVCSLMIVAMAGAAHGTPPGAGSDLKGAPPGAGSNLEAPLKAPDQTFRSPSIGSAFAADATGESCFVSAINATRSSAGLTPLVTNGDLLRVARVWSAKMAASGGISHNPNIGNLAPADWSSLGENVGFGPTCDSVIQAFTGSPEHLKNILDPSYSSLGVGVVDGSNGLMYVTEDFMGTGGSPVQAAHGPPPRPVEAAPVPVAPSPPPVAEPAAPAPVAVPIPNPTSVSVPRAIPAPAPKSPAPPASQATAVPVLVALPIMDPALPVEGDAAPGAGVQKGILGGIVNALDAFFARQRTPGNSRQGSVPADHG